jgi:hypothetical protein
MSYEAVYLAVENFIIVRNVKLHLLPVPLRECYFIFALFEKSLVSGSLLAFSTQVRGFKPSRSRGIFKGKKILSTPSFRGEVKPSVPCRRFATCKRSLNGLEVVISGKLPDNILAHSSTFRRWDLLRRGGRGCTWWRKLELLNTGKAMANYP